MKLTRVHIISAATCGGLLDGLDVRFRDLQQVVPESFEPLCLVGPNGTGKSQFMQIVAEAFQSAFCTYVSEEERVEANSDLQFEIEYLIRPVLSGEPVRVRLSRLSRKKRARPTFLIQEKKGVHWIDCPTGERSRSLLPSRIIGYTSGENETLSLPFLVSRAGYAEAVRTRALGKESSSNPVSDTRLMLIDYGTHLEVLVANLLLGSEDQIESLLGTVNLKNLHSFRCVIQLAHSAVPKLPRQKNMPGNRKGIQLTSELEETIDYLKRCSTCYTYDEKIESYTFDFLVTSETRTAFAQFWATIMGLYTSFHKLAMLNDLAIPKASRERFRREVKSRRFAARLPEPQDEDRVFRFEQVRFISRKSDSIVDYVSLSDGEHQLFQILGTMCMASKPNTLFLLDEPESHFNPLWRVKFISHLLALPTASGLRENPKDQVAQQDCLLTTHAPFVPSDMPRKNVLIFTKTGEKVEICWPQIETFGSTFDSILQECFGVHPPISELPRQEIEKLMSCDDPEVLKSGISELGDSVEKVFLLERLWKLSHEEKQ